MCVQYLCVLTVACLCPLQLLKAQRVVLMSQAKALTQGAVMQIHKCAINTIYTPILIGVVQHLCSLLTTVRGKFFMHDRSGTPYRQFTLVVLVLNVYLGESLKVLPFFLIGLLRVFQLPRRWPLSLQD